ncbi:MAG: hypothetical protein QXW70_02650 [Candidatus Anstonellales archaeon]
MRKGREQEIAEIVRERVGILLGLAEKAARKNLERARKYIRMARRLSEKYRVRFKRLDKLRFCKRCNAPFIPGYSVRVGFVPRFHSMTYRCTFCGFEFRFPYKKYKNQRAVS